jgi:hypothetical protein
MSCYTFPVDRLRPDTGVDIMGRSIFSPITPDGRLRNNIDRLLLAALAIGLQVEAHCREYEESEEAAKRALQRLSETLGASSRYVVLVWAMNRKLLSDEYLYKHHRGAAYRAWCETVSALEARPLTADQVRVLISYVNSPYKTLHTHWSQPDKHPEIAGILDQLGLPASGRGTYAIVVSAAAFAQQVQWEDIPGPDALKFTAPNGVVVTVSLSGSPELVRDTLADIKTALGLSK